jgi:hypothetical protein
MSWFSLDPRTGEFVPYTDEDVINDLEYWNFINSVGRMGCVGYFVNIPYLNAIIHIRYNQHIHRQKIYGGGIRDVIRLCGCTYCFTELNVKVNIKKHKNIWNICSNGVEKIITLNRSDDYCLIAKECIREK